MKASRLPEHDRRECDEVSRDIQSRSSELLPLQVRAAVLGAILLACLAGEYVLSYQVVFDAIGPLPGEPPSAAPAVVAMSGMICVAAFYLFRRAFPKALPVRAVDRSSGYIALGYLVVMGLMLGNLIYTNMGGGAAPIELFGAGDGPADTPLLARFFEWMRGPFALVFGFLTVVNLYVAETVGTRLRETLRELHGLRERLRESRELMNEIDESERELAKLEAERQTVLRGLEPAGAYGFAGELAVMVAESRAPIEAWITAQHLRKKPPESVLAGEDTPDIDVAKLKERVNALKFDAKVIYGAFAQEPNTRTKS